MEIILKGVTKTFQESDSKRLIFENTSIQFPQSDISVVLGRSGVGKSSLLNLISGIDLPDSGTVRVGNLDVSRMSDDKRSLFRRRHVGFIYQFFNLIPVLTVLENVLLVAELDGKTSSETMDRAKFLLDHVGILDRSDQYPDRLSGGEQQRVAIVRALVNEPDIILADEPTGNLDVHTGGKVLEMIAALVEQEKKTLVMVTHSSEALGFANGVYMVENNQIRRRKHGMTS